jgi:hypothetical protein
MQVASCLTGICIPFVSRADRCAQILATDAKVQRLLEVLALGLPVAAALAVGCGLLRMRAVSRT